MAYKTLDLQSACKALHAGEVVAFPTETFFGLGCDALNPDAVGSVYAMKQRPYGLPLPVILGDLADLDRVAVYWTSDLVPRILESEPKELDRLLKHVLVVFEPKSERTEIDSAFNKEERRERCARLTGMAAEMAANIIQENQSQ